MSTHYRLHPPFLYVPEQEDFSRVWENFCCKLLNISNATTEIYVRNPPEQGVDIYYPSMRTAYQCKSVESGKSGDFNAAKAVESIEAAKRAKSEIGWERYVLCVNVAVSGAAEAALKRALSEIEILPKSHWIQLCEKNPLEVERNFRRLIEVPRPEVLDAIQGRFVDHYSLELQKKVQRASFDVLLYSNRHDTTYRVPVSDEFTCNDLLEIIRQFFKLPESTSISSQGIDVSLSHAVVFNGKKVPLALTLRQAGITRGSIITYWTTIGWKDTERQFDGNVMHRMTPNMISRPTGSLEERRDAAIASFTRLLKKRFDELDGNLISKGAKRR